MKKLLKLILILVAVCMALHFFMTGSPIPLYRIERLKNPQTVTHIECDALLLKDGRRIRLPFVNEIPEHDGFRKALERGVEVDARGRVYGQIRVHSYCGNDPVRLDLRRVDLSALAAVLDPDSLSLSEADPTFCKQYLESFSGYKNPDSEYGWSSMILRYIETVETLLDNESPDTLPHMR